MLRSLLHALLLPLLVLALAAPALAQEGGDGAGDASQATSGDAKQDAASDEAEKKKAKKQKKRRTWGRKGAAGGKEGEEEAPVAGQTFLKKFAPGQEAYSEERYADCVEVLRKIRTKRLTPYEKALLYRLIAYSLYAQEDTIGAREELQKAVATNGFMRDEQARSQFTIARLYVAEQDWDNVIVSLNKWFEISEEESSSAYHLLALAYFQKGDYKDAVEPAQKSVDLATTPNEGWLRLLLAVRLTLEEYDKAVPVLEDLVRYFPKKTYWLQLSTVHGALGSYENALVPLQLAYAQDLLDTDAELRRLAQLLMFLELPYRAAEVLGSGLDSGSVEPNVDAWEMLSNSWIAAREYEKAVEPLETAANLDPTGDLFVRLAQVHIQREKWDDAVSALDRAIQKGDLEKPGDAVVLMGIAHYSNKAPGTARGWFMRARGYAGTQKEADTWIQFIDRELAAQAAAQDGQEQPAAQGDTAGEGEPAASGETAASEEPGSEIQTTAASL